MMQENENNFRRLLAALAEAGGIEMPAPEADGRVLMELDDGLGVALEPMATEEGGADAVVATFVIGNANAASAEALGALLAANYLWARSANGSFAVEEGTGLVVLQRAFELPIDSPAEFVEAFGQLAGAAREYRERLASGGASETADRRGVSVSWV